MTPTPHFTNRGCARVMFFALLSAFWLTPEVFAAKPGKAKLRAEDGDQVPAAMADAKLSKREEKANGRTDAANATDAEARQLTRLRERLEVTDDAEWVVITERLTKVEDLRRGLTARVTPRGNAPAAGDKGKRGGRAGSSSELEALRSAVTDQYPEAEIKARLARAHEMHLQQEAQLARAQTDLRSVLTVRQEAIMVMMGLLPP